MSIPLVQEATKDAINTSIIAIKRNIERINMLLGLVDNDSPDLSGFATKQELQDAVTELQPVDEVTADNMQSVTSNAVAAAFGEWEQLFISSTVAVIRGLETKNGKYLSLHFNGLGSSQGALITTLAEKWRPKTAVRAPIFADAYAGFIQVNSTGVINVYSLVGSGSFDIRGDCLILIETEI